MSEARQRILETASRLFAERGYELVGINELIEKSEVAKATFYQHFKSKEKLCAEWLKMEAGKYESAARELLDRDISPLKKVEMKFDELKKFLKASDFRGCCFSNTATVMICDNEVREVVAEYKAASRLFWQALALELKREPSAARALGDGFFLLYSGAVTEAQNTRSLWPVDSAKAAVLTLCQS